MARYELPVGADLYTVNTGHKMVYIGSDHQDWAQIINHNSDGLQEIRLNGERYKREKNESEKDFIRRVRNS